MAVTPNSNFLLMEQVPAEHVDAVLRLGFTQHLDSGNWIKVGGSQLNSKEFQREFPKLKTISYENDEYVLNIKNRPPKKAPNKGSAPDASNTDHLSATFLGLNKYKEKVFELNGKRFRANDRGRRIAEGSLARPSLVPFSVQLISLQ